MHGVHSPFVYDFVENGIQKTPASSLREMLNRYFGETMIVLIDEAPETWPGRLSDQMKQTGSGKVIAIENIHASIVHTRTWEELKSKEAVKLSIDLFACGLLLFRDEFKEKQHFIIKWPQ